jgi:SAM-dependent methyltransferase
MMNAHQILTAAKEGRSMKLEIGGGSSPVPGLVQAEGRWGYEPLPYPDGEYDLVYASHVIEHIPWWKSQDAVDDASRLLKRNGCLEIHTVDFRYLVCCYLADQPADNWDGRGNNPDHDYMLSIASRIFSVGEPDDLNWHRAIFDMAHLTRLIINAGLVIHGYPKEPRGPTKHGKINIGIRGLKL